MRGGDALLEGEIQIEVVQRLGYQFPAEFGFDIAKPARRDHMIGNELRLVKAEMKRIPQFQLIDDEDQ